MSFAPALLQLPRHSRTTQRGLPPYSPPASALPPRLGLSALKTAGSSRAAALLMLKNQRDRRPTSAPVFQSRALQPMLRRSLDSLGVTAPLPGGAAGADGLADGNAAGALGQGAGQKSSRSRLHRSTTSDIPDVKSSFAGLDDAAPAAADSASVAGVDDDVPPLPATAMLMYYGHTKVALRRQSSGSPGRSRPQSGAPAGSAAAGALLSSGDALAASMDPSLDDDDAWRRFESAFPCAPGGGEGQQQQQQQLDDEGVDERPTVVISRRLAALYKHREVLEARSRSRPLSELMGTGGPPPRVPEDGVLVSRRPASAAAALYDSISGSGTGASPSGRPGSAASQQRGGNGGGATARAHGTTRPWSAHPVSIMVKQSQQMRPMSAAAQLMATPPHSRPGSSGPLGMSFSHPGSSSGSMRASWTAGVPLEEEQDSTVTSPSRDAPAVGGPPANDLGLERRPHRAGARPDSSPGSSSSRPTAAPPSNGILARDPRGLSVATSKAVAAMRAQSARSASSSPRASRDYDYGEGGIGGGFGSGLDGGLLMVTGRASTLTVKPTAPSAGPGGAGGSRPRSGRHSGDVHPPLVPTSPGSPALLHRHAASPSSQGSIATPDAQQQQQQQLSIRQPSAAVLAAASLPPSLPASPSLGAPRSPGQALAPGSSPGSASVRRSGALQAARQAMWSGLPAAAADGM